MARLGGSKKRIREQTESQARWFCQHLLVGAVLRLGIHIFSAPACRGKRKKEICTSNSLIRPPNGGGRPTTRPQPRGRCLRHLEATLPRVPAVYRFNSIAYRAKVWVTQPGSKSVIEEKPPQRMYGWDHRPQLEASSEIQYLHCMVLLIGQEQ